VGTGPSTPAETVPAAVISTRGTVAAASGGREVPVRVACAEGASGDCTGTVTLYALTRKARSRSAAQVKLGSKRFRIAPGRTGTVRVRVVAKRRGLLAGRKVRVLAKAVTFGPSGAVAGVTRRTFTVKVAKARSRR
jgi:hypothetical protein